MKNALFIGTLALGALFTLPLTRASAQFSPSFATVGSTIMLADTTQPAGKVDHDKDEVKHESKHKKEDSDGGKDEDDEKGDNKGDHNHEH